MRLHLMDMLFILMHGAHSLQSDNSRKEKNRVDACSPEGNDNEVANIGKSTDFVSANIEEIKTFDKVQIVVLRCKDHPQPVKISLSEREGKATEEKCQVVKFGIPNYHSNNHLHLGPSATLLPYQITNQTIRRST
ncbi:hypothetical protein Nepgr_016677 [Nepenthes gracilis]|uniref:Uncharacterized protein n=1 Tax=Nepenthes gracilis TaxID=150966 RepID=A0AAD3XSK2_NEPGR|nr:hypothetical protein Nepgr_016677 [Nepenthes gracilis]